MVRKAAAACGYSALSDQHVQRIGLDRGRVLLV